MIVFVRRSVRSSDKNERSLETSPFGDFFRHGGVDEQHKSS